MIKPLFAILLLSPWSTAGVPARADTGEDAHLTLHLKAIGGKVKGDGYLSLYRDAASWLKEDKAFKRLTITRSAIKDGQTTVSVKLPVGTYSVAVWFDRDGDGKMDKNFLGIPIEPMALSNDQRPTFGPPRFKKSLITVTTGENSHTMTVQ